MTDFKEQMIRDLDRKHTANAQPPRKMVGLDPDLSRHPHLVSAVGLLLLAIETTEGGRRMRDTVLNVINAAYHTGRLDGLARGEEFATGKLWEPQP